MFLLPGVPHLLSRKLPVVKSALLAMDAHAPLQPFQSTLLRLREGDETRVAPALREAQEAAGEYGWWWRGGG